MLAVLRMNKNLRSGGYFDAYVIKQDHGLFGFCIIDNCLSKLSNVVCLLAQKKLFIDVAPNTQRLRFSDVASVQCTQGRFFGFLDPR